MFGSLAVLLGITAIQCFSQVTDGAPTAEGRSREVFAAITEWADAVRDRDTLRLERIFEDYAIVTLADGTTRGKKEEIDLFRFDPKTVVLSVTNDDLKVRVFGMTAVATGLNIVETKSGSKTSTFAFRYTATFVKQDDRWQIVALHTSRISRAR